jgi:hypothetical protein
MVGRRDKGSNRQNRILSGCIASSRLLRVNVRLILSCPRLVLSPETA